MTTPRAAALYRRDGGAPRLARPTLEAWFGRGRVFVHGSAPDHAARHAGAQKLARLPFPFHRADPHRHGGCALLAARTRTRCCRAEAEFTACRLR
ncbi:hypothetical protein ACU4GD_23315 [Cupriavidus basilensis]